MNHAHRLTPSPHRRSCAFAFAREDALLAELREVRAVQVEARNDYAEAHGLLIRPGVRALRGGGC